MAVPTQLDSFEEGNFSSFAQRSAHRYIYIVIMQCEWSAQGNGDNAEYYY
jgi:hypothetical protein